MQAVAPALDMYAPGGTVVPVTEVKLSVRTDGAGIHGISLLFNLDAAVWARVERAGWFRSPATARGPCFGGPFQTDRPVRVEACLDRDLELAVAVVILDARELGSLVRDARTFPSLRLTESWQGRWFTQAHGPIRVGFEVRGV